MDSYRQIQKADCLDGSGKRKYGCPCCRKISDLCKHKKVSRKLARRRLRQRDRIELN